LPVRPIVADVVPASQPWALGDERDPRAHLEARDDAPVAG
jgi:hypothetical protein